MSFGNIFGCVQGEKKGKMFFGCLEKAVIWSQFPFFLHSNCNKDISHKQSISEHRKRGKSWVVISLSSADISRHMKSTSATVRVCRPRAGLSARPEGATGSAATGRQAARAPCWGHLELVVWTKWLMGLCQRVERFLIGWTVCAPVNEHLSASSQRSNEEAKDE